MLEDVWLPWRAYIHKKRIQSRTKQTIIEGSISETSLWKSVFFSKILVQRYLRVFSNMVLNCKEMLLLEDVGESKVFCVVSFAQNWHIVDERNYSHWQWELIMGDIRARKNAQDRSWSRDEKPTPLNVSATSRPVDLLDIADVLREEAEWQAHWALAATHKVVRVAECTRVLLSDVTSMSSRDVQDADREDTLMHSLTVSDTKLWRGLAPPCWSTGQRPSNSVLCHETEDERTSIQTPRSTTRKKT